MSFQAMTWAIDQKLPAKEKLVLLMLANYCNSHTGQCNPSHSRLSDECGMSKNTLLSAIKSLESKAHLQVIRKRIGDVNLPNQYELNFSGSGAEIEPPSSLNAPGSANTALSNAIKLRKMSFKNKASSFVYGNSIVCWLTIFCEMDFDLHVAESDWLKIMR